MTKYIVVVGIVLVLAVGAFAVYTWQAGAQKDVEAITKGADEVMTKEKVESVLKSGETMDFRTASKAIDSIETFEPAKQLDMLKVVLKEGDAALRMKATQKLTQLSGAVEADAQKILADLSKDEKADAELAALVQKHLADKQLQGKEGTAKRDTITAMLEDERPGFRLAGLNALDIKGSDERAKLLDSVKKLAADMDETVSMMAEMILEDWAGAPEAKEGAE